MYISIFGLVCIIFVSASVGAGIGILVIALCMAAKERDELPGTPASTEGKDNNE